MEAGRHHISRLARPQAPGHKCTCRTWLRHKSFQHKQDYTEPCLSPLRKQGSREAADVLDWGPQTRRIAFGNPSRFRGNDIEVAPGSAFIVLEAFKDLYGQIGVIGKIGNFRVREGEIILHLHPDGLVM